MSKLIARFRKNENGATAIEYGLIAGIMAVAVIAAFTLLGDGLETAFTNLSGALSETPSTLN
ncbi:Flp family type IVb pilin [Aureimonas populi]|uniref:Flp family type IVb pilin n=1 Tax=Aureimonas populi TaxID=1701758 RepID=A0ABW5CQ15_9HYPH|nr:Flp family type IVb pilin [Aureimonas populi]